ncbi:MAG TPA: divalent cation tolerance protein CutA [Candidatus Bathyarchaeota archaeon]|nr:divalent cation tolerance protein CutA [Candidatus Bathyarchaeota archaeon]
MVLSLLAVVPITCPDKQTAEGIAELLLRRRLAACVNETGG